MNELTGIIFSWLLSETAYIWIKAFHLISIISWMAGLLYLPRLFVYHCLAQRGSDKSETFKIMERRLLRLIMNPAMVLSWFFGCLLIINLGDQLFVMNWVYIKFAGVFFLTVIHMMMARWRKDFEKDQNHRDHKFFRAANEVPTILMIIIVIVTVVKPF